jgi:methyltransferase
MVALHSGFLVAMLVEAWVRRPDVQPTLAWTMLGLVVASQVLRWWCIATLGRRWNTRVIIVPGLAPVTSGPYRFMSHPNYVAVVVEGIALPLVHEAWITALVFTVANAALLTVRIRVENAALRTLPGRFADA